MSNSSRIRGRKTSQENERTVLRNVYDALSRRDVQTLNHLIHPEFTASISVGMPLGVGGEVLGVEAMISNVWGVIAGAFDVSPRPGEFVEAGEGRMVVFGTYVGHCMSTGRRFEAAFVHDWRFDDGRVGRLSQITDTAAWHHALATT